MFSKLNRLERQVVERCLPEDAPVSGLTMISDATQGGLLWLVICAGLALWPGRWRAGARDAAVSVAAASALAHLTGRVLVRRRPAASDVPAYQALAHKPTSSSFPSAHAAVAAAFTTALVRRIGLAGLVVVPLAQLVAYSRVRSRAHWPTDVAAGIVQGVLVGEAVHRLMARRPRSAQPGR
ncbi:MAG: phosphatase PAP2 family protein [Pseudonocardia sp.]|nr:phosphatase PAP2 family protein [Pseudonocardia sp.]